MKPRYSLNVFEPGSTKDVLAIYQSETAFPSLEVGTRINPVAEASKFAEALIITDVETRVWLESNVTYCKSLVFTELQSKLKKGRKK